MYQHSQYNNGDDFRGKGMVNGWTFLTSIVLKPSNCVNRSMLKPGKSRQKFVTVSKLYSQVGHETISNYLNR